MVATNWGINSTNDFSVVTDPLDQSNPSVADSGGGSFGVAWTSAAGVSVRFYDVIGQLDPELGTIQLTTSATAKEVSLTAGGVVGYAAAWEEDGSLMARYSGLGAPVGGAFAVAAGTPGAVTNHDASTSGYSVDNANGKPIVDGFNVGYISTVTADALTPAQIVAGYGRVMLQRFAVPLDAKKDPAGPPVAAGLDGVVGGDADAAVTVAAIGRDVSVATDATDQDTMVAWIDTLGRVHAQIYTLGGAVIAPAAIVGANLANLGTAAATSDVKVISSGAGFVVAWTDVAGIVRSEIFASAGASTYTASAAALLNTNVLPGGSTFTGEFSIGALLDTNGFALTVGGQTGPGDKNLYVQSYNGGGGTDLILTQLNTTVAGDQNAPALAGLVGDRIIAVYQDDPSASGGDQNIRATILDTRSAGQTINGDPVGGGGGGGAARPTPDVLVGTIGNDTINGLADNDELYGALGDDRLIGAAGNDLIDGGANGAAGDSAVYTGNLAQYSIDFLGGDVFTITDSRAASPDGTDTIRGIENLVFADQTVTTASISGAIVPVTPTAWGWTNADANSAPDVNGDVDVDGFVVDNIRHANGAIDANPYAADSVGEFIGVVWESAASLGADTHIRGRFYDVIGGPDGFTPNSVNLSDGVGIESNAVIVSGGANSGWGVAWEELSSPTDTTHSLRTNFFGPGALTGSEQDVWTEAATVDQHDIAMSRGILDRTLASPVGGSVLPTGMNEGYNVAWVSTDATLNPDSLSAADIAAGYGRVMMQRFEAPLDALGNPGAPVGAGQDGIAGEGSDAAFNVSGAIGRDPSTAALHSFETAVIWIEKDGGGIEHLKGTAYDDLGQAIPGFDDVDISGAFSVAAGTTAHIAAAAAVNFGVVWVTANGASPSGFTVMGTMFASNGAGLNGVGFGFASPPPVALFDLPSGVNVSNLQMSMTGLSGEDSADLAISWNSGSGDVKAQHIKVALDPQTGIVLAMASEGAAVTVNADTTGTQDNGVVAGLLGDRFITVYHDTSSGDGNDIVARIMDTRDAVDPDPITGDLVRVDGGVQARRDVLVGTNGNDVINGDLSNSNGLVDFIYAGMGNDIVQGGPGVRGAAGIPEMIDGGIGNDTAVYSGRLQDYSITVNGDGSYEIVDLRPVQNGAGVLQNNDGIDNLFNFENIQFLDLSNGGAGAQTITFGFPGTPPATPVGYNGTPVAWSLDDTSANKEIAVDHTATITESGIAVTNLQDGAGLAWISGTTANEVWAISYDTTGEPDPVLLDVNTKLTDGTFSANTVSNIDIAMTGGLGMTAAWESTNAGDSEIHLRFASTNTIIAGAVAPGVVGVESVVVGSQEGGAEDAIGPVLQGYEIVDGNNDTLEVGVHVGFVMQDGTNDTNAGDAYGALTLARYEIPVYDVNAAGTALAVDGSGNFLPTIPTNFGVGAEMAPISIGLDGLRGTADDGVAILVTDQGLFDADNVPGTANVLQGRDISIGSLHDGQLVVSYIDSSENVQLRIYVPQINVAADRELTAGLGGVDVIAAGVTTYSELALPPAMTAGLSAVASLGQTAFVVPQQNGSFGLFWAAANGANIDIKGIVYSGAGTNWSPSPVLTFASGLPATTNFQIASTGVTPGGLEDGFFVSWETGAGISGQRFDLTGATVGTQIVVGDPTSGTPGAHSAVGIDDGRMLVGYVDGTDVSAQFLDNREPGVALIGPRTGAPADVIVGTVRDDAIDGRALDDQLFGGLGNDLITMGSGADLGFGGDGNDQIIAGSGQDQLLGEAGDDLLWGGLSGPAEPFNADIDAAIAAAGAAGTNGLSAATAAALIASNPGADIISGGTGIDTISYQGEFGNFNVNLSTGITTSDRDQNGSFVLEDVMGVEDDISGTFTFTNGTASADIENATGGLGDDTLIGTGGDNVLDGGAGNNTFDGLGGTDTVIINGEFDEYLVSYNSTTNTFTFADADHTDTVKNAEVFVFKDVTKTLADLVPVTTTITSDGGGATASVAVAENSALVTTVSATGGTGPIYSIDGGADAFKFAINAATGALSFKNAPNFEAPTDVGANNVYDVIVKATSGTTSDTQAIAVSVNNINEAPTIVSSNTASFAESAANGTFIGGVLSATDTEGSAVKFVLTNDADGRFQIVKDAAGYHLAVAQNLLIDHQVGDASHGYSVQVQAVDADGLSTLQTISLTATGVVENRITGTAANNSLNGTAGIDYINGLAGRDTMTGGAGNDAYVVESSSDRIVEAGNGGIDTVYTTLTNFDLSSGNFANVENLVFTGAANFTAKAGNAASTIIGAGGADALQGGSANDTLEGRAGNDTLSGNNGNDTLIGGTGNDNLSGGAGNDRLVGGWGIDTMAGGAGNDTFVFTDVDVGTGVRDTITDFRAGDRIDLSSIDASLLTIGDDAFRLVAANTAFTSDFGEVHAVQVNGNTIIEGHLAGHTDIDFQIQLSGLQTITAASFVL